MTYRPRHLRSTERGLRAADNARNAGKSALDCAIADIKVRFDKADRVNRFKQRCESALRRGPENENIRMWYAPVSSLLHRWDVRTFARANQIIAAEYIRTLQIEQAMGAPRLLIKREVLDEVFLILRWLRRYRPDIDVHDLISAMIRGPDHRPVIHFVNTPHRYAPLLSASPRLVAPRRIATLRTASQLNATQLTRSNDNA